MTHDPLCLDMTTRARFRHERGVCYCDLISRVREEWYEAQSEAWEQGFHHALSAARDAVAGLRPIYYHGKRVGDCVKRDDALAAIDGLRALGGDHA